MTIFQSDDQQKSARIAPLFHSLTRSLHLSFTSLVFVRCECIGRLIGRPVTIHRNVTHLFVLFLRNEIDFGFFSVEK